MISQIQIQNFKAFRDQTLRLAPLTILAGLNGSGKSSLVQSLLLIRQGFESGSLGKGRIALNGDYIKLGSPADVRNESASEDFVSFTVRFDDAEHLQISFSFQSENDRVPLVSNEPRNYLPAGLFDSDFIFLAADRVSPQVFYVAPDGFASTGKLGIHGERTAHFLSQFGERNISLPQIAHSEARSLQLSHQVEAWMGEVSPGVQIHPGQEPSLDVVSLSYSFKARRDTSRRFRATNIGFGVTYALPVLTAVLSAKLGDLLIIESPEAHLHPRGQAKIGELFALAAQAGVQIIFETHSDHILNGVRVAIHQNRLDPEKAVVQYFRWNPSSEDLATTVEEIIIDSDGRIAKWPEGFFDEFDKSLDILLTPKPSR